METAVPGNNSYSDVQFKGAKARAIPSRWTSSQYSWRESSRSLSDADHLSSFLANPEVIDSLFEIEDPGRVHQYIRQHPELFSLLLRIRGEAYWLFGPKAHVTARIEQDPEAEFAPRLLVLIRTELNAGKAINLLDDLDRRWWLSVSPASRVLLKIDVEYV